MGPQPTERIFRSPYPQPAIPTNMSLMQLWTTYNPDDVSDDKIILADDWTGKTLTYGGARTSAARGAQGLREMFNLGIGDVVAVCASNSVDHVRVMHAVFWAGGTVSAFNPMSSVDDFAHYLEISQAKILVIDFPVLEVASAAIKQLGSSLKYPIEIMLLGTRHERYKSFPEDIITPERSGVPVFDLSTDDSRNHIACICFSSGTSGKAKGAEISHYAIVAALLGNRASDPGFMNADGRGLFFAPICHIYGMNTVVCTGPYLGFHTVLMKRYILLDLVKLSSEIKANTLRILPTIAIAIAKEPRLAEFDLTSVKFVLCSGAPLSKEILGALQQRLGGAAVFQGYGMTEANISTLRPHLADKKSGSVGKLYANTEARLVDDDLNDVELGKEGEMIIRGPTIFTRYRNNAKETASTFHNGWMRTGDILRIDEDGFFWLTDRKKELIKYKGNQVAPAELESLLLQHPHVREAIVCARWDEAQHTEVPMAYVVLQEELLLSSNLVKQPILDQIRVFVDGKVTPYKRLRGGVEWLEAIPKTATGKVLRRELPEVRKRAREKETNGSML